MADRSPSAAASIYPHLLSAGREPVQRTQRNGTIAEAMYPRPKPTAPQPKPPSTNKWREDWAAANAKAFGGR